MPSKDDSVARRAVARADRARARDELRADVALMRELGVARWGEIVLGPSPTVMPLTRSRSEVEEAARVQREAERRHETLFAASSVRPIFERQRAPFSADNVAPRTSAPRHDGEQPAKS